MEEQPQVDEHAHADEEVGDEDGIADELNAVHQWRHMGNETVQYEAGEECSDDAVETDGLAQGSTHEEHCHDEDELHHGIAVAAQKPARQPWQEQEQYGNECSKFGCEEHPEPHTSTTAEGSFKGSQTDECQQQSQHGTADAVEYAGLAL